MISNSILETYTLIFGWNLYEVMVDVLNGTGLAYLPFVAAILSAVAQSYGDNSRDAVSRLEVSVITMMLVLMFCWMPYKGINTSLAAVQYTISVTDCNPPPNLTGNGASTNTGFDAVMGDLSSGGSTAPSGTGLSVSQPIGWALVQYISSAITYSAITASGCSNNYEFMLLRLANTKIGDDQLKERVQDFHANCYKPALARWAENPVPNYNRVVAQPWDDIDWLGSRELLSHGPLGRGEYYQHPDVYLRDQDRYGWLSDPALRQSDKENEGTANPYCQEVWLGSQGVTGIRGLLLQDLALQIDAEGHSPLEDFREFGFESFTTAPDLPAADKDDLFLKLVLQADAANLNEITNVSMADNIATETEKDSGIIGSLFGLAASAFGAYGAAGELAQGMMMKWALKTAGPMLLAMIQMVIIIASPFLLVLSSFSFRMFIQLAITYFAVEFVNAIWAFGYFFDNRILDVYFSNAEGWEAPFSAAVVMAVGIGQIFLLPIVWLSLMASVGNTVLRSLGGTVGVGAVAATGRHGLNAARGVVHLGSARGAGGSTHVGR